MSLLYYDPNNQAEFENLWLKMAEAWRASQCSFCLKLTMQKPRVDSNQCFLCETEVVGHTNFKK